MRYLVTGVSGLLGIHLGLYLAENQVVTGVVNNRTLNYAPFPIIKQELGQLDSLDALVKQEKPDCIIHCAAMANIDECENNPDQADLINAQVPKKLAELTNQSGTRFVHISTDAVFDGSSSGYTEEDTANPLSVYARTKFSAENFVLQHNPDAVIARVNFYGWSITGKRSLAEWFYYQLKAGNHIKGFTDIQFCPLYVGQLAKILVELAETSASGIYHVVSREHISKYQFGVAIANAFNFDSDLIAPVSWTEGGLAAARSPNLILDVSKISKLLNRDMPDQMSGMADFVEAYKNDLPQRLFSYAT